MRLKCKDGKTREFHIALLNEITGNYDEASCCECGQYFGVRDTKILKPIFKEHTCKLKSP